MPMIQNQGKRQSKPRPKYPGHRCWGRRGSSSIDVLEENSRPIWLCRLLAFLLALLVIVAAADAVPTEGRAKNSSLHGDENSSLHNSDVRALWQMQKLVYGDTIRLEHVLTGYWLHSTTETYKDEDCEVENPEQPHYSGGPCVNPPERQKVTFVQVPGDNELWLVMAKDDAPKRHYVEIGDIVRFQHVQTGCYLHSNTKDGNNKNILSSVTRQHELACKDDNGDNNGDWLVLYNQDNSGALRVQHKNLSDERGWNHNLHSHDVCVEAGARRLGNYPAGQHESTVYGGWDPNDLFKWHPAGLPKLDIKDPERQPDPAFSPPTEDEISTPPRTLSKRLVYGNRVRLTNINGEKLDIWFVVKAPYGAAEKTGHVPDHGIIRLERLEYNKDVCYLSLSSYPRVECNEKPGLKGNWRVHYDQEGGQEGGTVRFQNEFMGSLDRAGLDWDTKPYHYLHLRQHQQLILSRKGMNDLWTIKEQVSWNTVYHEAQIHRPGIRWFTGDGVGGGPGKSLTGSVQVEVLAESFDSIQYEGQAGIVFRSYGGHKYFSFFITGNGAQGLRDISANSRECTDCPGDSITYSMDQWAYPMWIRVTKVWNTFSMEWRSPGTTEWETLFQDMEWETPPKGEESFYVGIKVHSDENVAFKTREVNVFCNLREIYKPGKTMYIWDTCEESAGVRELPYQPFYTSLDIWSEWVRDTNDFCFWCRRFRDTGAGGSVITPGSASLAVDGSWVIKGASMRFGYHRDLSFFVHEGVPRSGDFRATLALQSFDYIGYQQMAGIMVRESLSLGSKFFWAFLFGDEDYKVQTMWRRFTDFMPYRNIVSEHQVYVDPSLDDIRGILVQKKGKYFYAKYSRDSADPNQGSWQNLGFPGSVFCSSKPCLEFPVNIKKTFYVGIAVVSWNKSQQATFRAKSFDVENIDS